MIALISAYKNLIAIGALVTLGGAIVIGIYTAGIRHEQRKWALEMAERNKPIIEQRGKDEAELAAEGEAAKNTDAAISGAISQMCPATAETARLIAGLR